MNWLPAESTKFDYLWPSFFLPIIKLSLKILVHAKFTNLAPKSTHLWCYRHRLLWPIFSSWPHYIPAACSDWCLKRSAVGWDNTTDIIIPSATIKQWWCVWRRISYTISSDFTTTNRYLEGRLQSISFHRSRSTAFPPHNSRTHLEDMFICFVKSMVEKPNITTGKNIEQIYTSTNRNCRWKLLPY